MSDCQDYLEKKRSLETAENIIKNMNAGLYVYSYESLMANNVLTFHHKRMIRTYAEMYKDELDYQKLYSNVELRDDLYSIYIDFVWEYTFFDRYVPLYLDDSIPMYSLNNFPKYDLNQQFYWGTRERSDFFYTPWLAKYYKQSGLSISEIQSLFEPQLELIIDYATTFFSCIKKRNRTFNLYLTLYIQRLNEKYHEYKRYNHPFYLKIDSILQKAQKIYNEIS
jgi:hypothetical protein